MKKLIIIAILITGLLFGTGTMAQEVIVSERNELENNDINEFNQATSLEEEAASGELPSVEERLPEEPYVVKDREIGQYGGTLDVISLRPSVTYIDGRAMDSNSFLKPSPDGGEFLLNFAKKVEISEDTTTYTIHLRKGVKWSDGEPFTTEDIEFWYEDMLQNEEITPVIGDVWKTDGELFELNVIDDYTFEFIFSEPKPYFKPQIAHTFGAEPLVPKHYLKQFHPEYTDMEKIEAEAEEAGFDHWYEYFQDRALRASIIPGQPELPTLGPYTLVEKKSNRHIFERNPYYWKVDAEGNQLPYIKRIETEIVSDREVINGKIMSGEVDFEGAATDIRNYPMYKNYEDEGGYKTYLWNSGMGSEVVYMVNQTIEDENLRDIFQDKRFRRALSLGMDRDEISEAIYFGKAEPRQYTVLESSQYYEPEFAETYIEYNPDRAKELLDEIGIEDVDGDGWREGPDGEDFSFTIEYYDFETPKEPNVELVISFWQDLGLDVNSKAVSGELQGQRAPANMMDATVWHGDKASDVLFPMNNTFLIPGPPEWGASIWPDWGRWFETDGEEGSEPPAQVKELDSWYEDMIKEPDEEKRIELGKKILEAQAENLWAIGTVGDAPWPVIVKENLRNVPEDGLWVWDTFWSRTRDPSTFYFAD
ncbi:MAG: ABC transporter substrate-binding protein [Bacillota bacterium]